MKIFTQFTDKSANMESIADSMMDLDRQRDICTTVFLIVLSKREYGNQVVVAFLQIQVKSVKAFPRNHGNGEGVSGCIRLRIHFRHITILCNVIQICGEE